LRSDECVGVPLDDRGLFERGDWPDPLSHQRAHLTDDLCLVPLDTRTILAEVAKTGRLFTVEENPRLCGWGAEIVSIVAEEAFGSLRGPAVRITTPHVPLPAADALEDHVLPSVARITETVRKTMEDA